jgi:hypothetical protein
MGRACLARARAGSLGRLRKDSLSESVVAWHLCLTSFSSGGSAAPPQIGGRLGRIGHEDAAKNAMVVDHLDEAFVVLSFLLGLAIWSKDKGSDLIEMIPPGQRCLPQCPPQGCHKARLGAWMRGYALLLEISRSRLRIQDYRIVPSRLMDEGRHLACFVGKIEMIARAYQMCAVVGAVAQWVDPTWLTGARTCN